MTAQKSAERGNWKLRAFDRVGGTAILLAMRPFIRKRRSPPPGIRRIGILEISAIGDTLLVNPILRDLRLAYPEARITAFAAGNNAAAFKLLDGVDDLVSLPIRNPIASLKAIRAQGRFDLWIDFGQWPRINALFSAAARTGYRVGFKTRGQFRHYLYDLAVKHSDQLHEIENYRNLVRPLGVGTGTPPAIRAPGGPAARESYVVVHMFPGGSKSYLKEWPDDGWIAVIDHLTAAGRKVFLTGVEADRAAALRIHSRCARPESVEVLAGKVSLTACADLLAKAALVVSVNTGIMHMASLLGCDLVALNGPTSAKRWGPLNANAAAIQSPIHCSPCLNLGFEYGCDRNDCMKAIKPERVIREIDGFLAGRSERHG